MRYRQYNKRLAGLYQRIQSAPIHICIYCGDPTDSLDHFIPLSVAAMLSDLRLKLRKITVPCCVECNSIAADRFFPTIGAKRRYVQNALRRRYRGILAIGGIWDAQELTTLSHALRQRPQQAKELRPWILTRVAWRNVNLPRMSEYPASVPGWAGQRYCEGCGKLVYRRRFCATCKNTFEIKFSYKPKKG